MQNPAWLLIITGVLIALIGLGWLLSPSIPWLGRLPGDVVVERENFRFYFPITTCIVHSHHVDRPILWEMMLESSDGNGTLHNRSFQPSTRTVSRSAQRA